MTLKILTSKFALVAGLALVLGMASPAFAITALKQIRVAEGSRVDMEFDGKLRPAQIKTEFFNDVIQISLTDVSIYPAKIFSVTGPDLAKVFAYQYSPKLVRARLTVKGKAEAYKDRVDVQVVGNNVVVSFNGGGDRVVQSSAQAKRATSTPDVKAEAKSETAASAPAKTELSSDEKILLEKVLAQPAPSAKNNGAATVNAGSDGKSAAWGSGKKNESHPASSFLRMLGMLGIVLGAFLGCVMLLKQAKKLTGPGSKRFNGMLGRFVRVKLGHREKMIDVVATHYLGPKKSIAVVRVCGQLMVLGVANEAINLIAQLPDPGQGDVDGDAPNLDLEQMIGASIVQDFARTASGAAQISAPKIARAATAMPTQVPTGSGPIYSAAYGRNAQMAPPSSNSFSDLLQQENAKPSYKDRIKSRLEGMKQL